KSLLGAKISFLPHLCGANGTQVRSTLDTCVEHAPVKCGTNALQVVKRGGIVNVVIYYIQGMTVT
ncbi:MAG: hypothetical protein J6C87_10015, partial [Bacteroides sp.]|nr:hypothetical protein [Bacteroides sp.]